MATVHVAIGYSKGRGVTGVQLPVKSSLISRSVEVTSTASSADIGMVATQAEIDQGALWFVTVTGGDVYVAAGEDPTAAATSAHRVLSESTIELAINAVGETLAIKDAA